MHDRPAARKIAGFTQLRRSDRAGDRAANTYGLDARRKAGATTEDFCVALPERASRARLALLRWSLHGILAADVRRSC